MVDVSSPVRWLLRVIAVGYVFFLVAWPVSLVAVRTFENGNTQSAAALASVMMVVALVVIVALDIVQRRVANRG